MSHFDEIKSVTLRAYNRLVYATNLNEDAGAEAVKSYLEQFTNEERKQIVFMSVAVKTMGLDKVKAIVQKEVEDEQDGSALA